MFMKLCVWLWVYGKLILFGNESVVIGTHFACLFCGKFWWSVVDETYPWGT